MLNIESRYNYMSVHPSLVSSPADFHDLKSNKCLMGDFITDIKHRFLAILFGIFPVTISGLGTGYRLQALFTFAAIVSLHFKSHI